MTDKVIHSRDSDCRCPECGEIYVNIYGSLFATCPNAHGKLVRRVEPHDLRAIRTAEMLQRNEAAAKGFPKASPMFGRSYEIAGKEGVWCPASSEWFNEPPVVAIGLIVAAVRVKYRGLLLWRFRVFRQKSTRSRKSRRVGY